jgi:phosphatidylcholine synthase
MVEVVLMSDAVHRARAFAVHVFTASGATVALLALAAAIERDFPACFAWLGLALFIDGVDGTLARRVEVETHASWIKGETLDLVVDFLTYVIVPLTALWRAALLPEAISLSLCAIVAGASAIYFGDKRMKTADNWFRGFPALWNVAAFYCFAFDWPPALNAGLVIALALFMFAPIAFVHPMRVVDMRGVTVAVTCVWLASATLAIHERFATGLLAKCGLALGALWFLVLTVRRTPKGVSSAPGQSN